MLCINGFTCYFTSILGFTPKKNGPYWGDSQKAAFFVLKDFNAKYIHPGAGMFSSAKKRYRDGYFYAQQNINELRSHILISGNRLQMVAHSHGAAFAEGIAAFLFEEDSFITDTLIVIQGTHLANMPQIQRAISCRVEFKTDGDFVANRGKQQSQYNNVEVTETALKTGFTRYRIVQNLRTGLPGAEYIYMRRKIHFLKKHRAQRERQFEVWTAINHALAIYKREPENAYLFSPKHIQPEMLRQYADNQN
jgi:hypothetical protein